MDLSLLHDFCGDYTGYVVTFFKYAFAILFFNILGMTWYSARFFGNMWVKQAFPGGFPEQLMKDGTPYIVGNLSALFSCVFLDTVQSKVGLVGWCDACWIGAALGAFVMSLEAVHYAFSHRGSILFFIDQMFTFVVVVGMSCVIGFFNTMVTYTPSSE